MQPATERTVLADFAAADLLSGSKATSFRRRDGRFLVRTEGPDGVPQEYEIAYTFGVYPLQQYLVAFPGGRLQALGVAWDSRPKAEGGQRWFALADKPPSPGDPLHWTGRDYTWNTMCADCHSTGLRRGFDPASGSYATTWSEVNVACEACHGPGADHVAWANAAPADRTDPRKGLAVTFTDRGTFTRAIGLATRPARPPGTEMDACGACHARRQEIADAIHPGHPLLDSAVPTLLENRVYFPDGQILDEVFEYGSFLQSRMAQQGVTCTDCHEPHAARLRAPGNALCGTCHEPARFDAASHHHHEPGSPAAQCVSCHMPTRTYMQVHARHDHSVRVPRPDLATGPNACTACHADRPASWTAAAVADWYGPERRREAHWGAAIEAGRKGRPGADTALAGLAQDPGRPGIVRATALSLLPRFAANAGPDMLQALTTGLTDADPLVRAASVDALAPFGAAGIASLVTPRLDDPVRAVRLAAARALASLPPRGLAPGPQAALDRATEEVLQAEHATAERPETQVSMGAFLAARGRTAEAEAAYRTATRIDPAFTPALVNLADLQRELGREDEAERLLRQAVAARPDDAAAQHALGLLLVRRHDLPAALAALGRAAALAPGNAQYAYVHAIALNAAGRGAEAIRVLQTAALLHPGDFDILMARATLARDAGDRAGVLAAAQALARAFPNNAEARALLRSVSP